MSAKLHRRFPAVASVVVVVVVVWPLFKSYGPLQSSWCQAQYHIATSIHGTCYNPVCKFEMRNDFKFWQCRKTKSIDRFDAMIEHVFAYKIYRREFSIHLAIAVCHCMRCLICSRGFHMLSLLVLSLSRSLAVTFQSSVCVSTETRHKRFRFESAKVRGGRILWSQMRESQFFVPKNLNKLPYLFTRTRLKRQIRFIFSCSLAKKKIAAKLKVPFENLLDPKTKCTATK